MKPFLRFAMIIVHAKKPNPRKQLNAQRNVCKEIEMKFIHTSMETYKYGSKLVIFPQLRFLILTY